MKKCIKLCIATTLLVMSLTSTVFAGEWKQNSTGWWYQNDDGTNPAASWKQIGDNWYYFNPKGYMNTSWVNVSGQWYYCEPSGEMRTSDLQTDVMLFKFNIDGSCLNFYQNTTPSTQAGWAVYNTTSLPTFSNAVLEGNVIYYNGQYWGKPDFVNSLKNEEVVYFNDASPAEQTNRYWMSAF